MRAARQIVIALAVAAAGLSGMATARPAAAVEPSGDLDEAVNGLTQAMLANDVAAVGSWLADDWIVIDGSGGIVDRARFLAVIGSGELVHDSMTFDAPEIRRIGDTRVWTARARVSGRYRSVPFQSDERSTSLWTWQNGRWLCRFTQLTTIAGAAAEPRVNPAPRAGAGSGRSRSGASPARHSGW